MAKAPRLPWRVCSAAARGVRRLLRAGLRVAYGLSLTVVSGLACEMPDDVLGLDSAAFRTVPSGIAAAWYDEQTTRYPHAVLGDAIEYGRLNVLSSDGAGGCRRFSVILDPAHVFEDLAPRLVDLDQDGQLEVATLRSHESRGAQIAIYGMDQNARFERIAQTPYIGQRFRWRAIVGIADLDGDGAIEIAEVDRPHLAKTLNIWRYDGDGLLKVASVAGLTNHRIGEDFITGGLRNCGQGVDMVLADAAWRRVMVVRFDGRGLEAEALGPFSTAALDRAMTCR